MKARQLWIDFAEFYLFCLHSSASTHRLSSLWCVLTQKITFSPLVFQLLELCSTLNRYRSFSVCPRRMSPICIMKHFHERKLISQRGWIFLHWFVAHHTILYLIIIFSVQSVRCMLGLLYLGFEFALKLEKLWIILTCIGGTTLARMKIYFLHLLDSTLNVTRFLL